MNITCARDVNSMVSRKKKSFYFCIKVAQILLLQQMAIPAKFSLQLNDEILLGGN